MLQQKGRKCVHSCFQGDTCGKAEISCGKKWKRYRLAPTLNGQLKASIIRSSQNFYFAIIRGVANGVEILVAQRLSIPNATTRTVRTALVLSSVYLTAYLILIFLLGGPVVDFFCSTKSAFPPTALRSAALALFPILALREMLETIQQILMGTLRGLGRTSALLRIQVIVSCLIWLPLLFVLRAEHPTVTAYWLSMPVYMLSSAILLVLAIRGRRETA